MSGWYKKLNSETNEETLANVGLNRTNAFVASSEAC
jgi:hypothetical protein